MLSVILYDNLHELDQLEFIRDKASVVKIICPNPGMADIYRENYSQHKKIEINTISKYISDNLNIYFADELKDRLISKADLMLKLAVVWKSKFKAHSFETFNQVFNLLTELRSFTINLDLVTEVLNEFDDIVRESVIFFWAVINELDLVDEHQAFYLLSEICREKSADTNDFSKRGSLVFWGFSHLTSIQLDLIKSISINTDVYIPFPKDVYENSLSSDWIRWVYPEDNSKPRIKKGEVEVIQFPAGKLSESLKGFINKYNINYADFYLMQKNPSFEELMEISVSELQFKVANQIFTHDADSIFSLLVDEYMHQTKPVKTEALRKMVLDNLNEVMIRLNENYSIKTIKVLIDYNSALAEWMELSDLNQYIDLFDLKILKKYVELNLPRTYYIPIFRGDSSSRVYGIESISGFKKDRVNILCINSKYSSLKKSEAIYSEKFYEFLSSIGPVRRTELDFQINRYYLRELLGCHNTYVFMESGQLERDISWKEIFDGLNINFHQTSYLEDKEGIMFDHLKNAITNLEKEDIAKTRLSATKLQAWLDCPRKYYFSYIDKIENKPCLESKITPDVLGELEHDIVESFFKSAENWNIEKHSNLAKMKFNNVIKEKSLKLDKLDYESSLREVITYSRTAIEEILRIKDELGLHSIHSEEKIDNDNFYRGQADIIGEGDKVRILIDMKRSPSSIPPLKEVLDYKKIQIPFYMNQFKDISISGYLCMSDIKKSSYYVFKQELKDQAIACGLIGVKSIKERLIDNDWIKKYREFEAEQIKEIEQEKEYLAKPISEKVCTWCVAKNICERGANINE